MLDLKVQNWHDVLSEAKEALESLPSFAELPKSIIHTDIHERNFILATNNEGVLIDWYDAGWSTPVVDIGYVFAQSCLWEESSQSEKIIILKDLLIPFYSSYIQKRLLTPQENAYLLWGMRFGNYSYAINAVIDAVKNNKDKKQFLTTHHDWKRFKYLRTNNDILSFLYS